MKNFKTIPAPYQYSFYETDREVNVDCPGLNGLYLLSINLAGEQVEPIFVCVSDNICLLDIKGDHRPFKRFHSSGKHSIEAKVMNKTRQVMIVTMAYEGEYGWTYLGSVDVKPADAIRNLSQTVQDLQKQIDIYRELVDRPDGAGCKYAFDQIQAVLDK